MFKNIVQSFFSKYKRIFDSKMKEAFKWSILGQFLSRSINLISAIILARLMAPEGYGEYIYIIGTLMFFAQLIGLSIRSTNTRNIAFLLSTDKIKAQKYIFISLLIGISLALIGFIILLLAVYMFQNNIIVKEYTVPLVSILLFAIFSEVIIATILGILEGVKSFKSINIFTIILALVKFIFSLIGFFIHDIDGAIIGWVIASFVGVIFYFSYLNNNLKQNKIILRRYKILECNQEIKVFFNFSIPSTLEALLVFLFIWIIQTIILGFGESGKKEIAIFNVANQWKFLAVYLPAILINMLQSFLSEFNGNGDKAKAVDLFINTKKIVTTMSFILIFIFGIFSKVIIGFYGKNYEQANVVLIILLIPVVFTNINALYRQFLMSQGRVWLIVINNLIGGLLVVFLFFILKSYLALSLSLIFAISIGGGEVFIFLFYYIFFKNKNIFI